MSDKTRETQSQDQEVKSVICRVLASGGKNARFVTELCAAVRRYSIDIEKVEPALAELAGEGIVMMRDHFCADPHLEGVDLRVVALVPSAGDQDEQHAALRAIDEAWDKWLTEYLSNHRCS